MWASDVEDLHRLLFDDEKNLIALHNQLPYFDAEVVASGASGQLSGSEVKRNLMARCNS
jgi:hypothetical protein